MKRWPLLLPPLAVSTSPSRSHHSSSSIVVKSPSRRSLPSSCCRHAVHYRSAAPSITVHLPSRCPSPPIAVVLSVHRRRARAVPRRRGAVAPSLAVEEPSRCPLPSRRCRAVHCRRAPYLAIKEPSAMSTDDSGHSSRPSNLQASCQAGCRVASPHAAASHLPAPLTLIAAIAFRASRPSSWLSRLLDSHAATSHLPAPPPLITPSRPLVMPISGLSSGWLRRSFSSRRRHLSAG